jgi:hypothetical protein
MRTLSYPKRVVESVANLRFLGGICLPLVLIGSAAQVACRDGLLVRESDLTKNARKADPAIRSGKATQTPTLAVDTVPGCSRRRAVEGVGMDRPEEATEVGTHRMVGDARLPTEPVMISPDGSRYIPEDAPNQIADALTGATLASFPAGDYNRVIGWTAAGIYLTHIGKGFLPGLWRIDPSSGQSPISLPPRR